MQPMNQTQTNPPVVLLTGASSGIGAAIAVLLARQGHTVYGASRSGNVPAHAGGVGEIVSLQLDVTNEESVQKGVARILDERGRLDTLIHAAGDGLAGPVEVSTAADAKAQMDVNYFGALRLLNAALPVMRAQGHGRVILIGSVGGVFPIPFQALYSSSKAALAMLAGGLRLELRKFPIQVSLVEPGDVRTGFTAARRYVAGACPDVYTKSMQRAISQMEKDEQTGMPPEAVAKRVAKLACAKKPAPRVVVGGLYRVFVFLKRFLPNRLVEWLLYQMYVS